MFKSVLNIIALIALTGSCFAAQSSSGTVSTDYKVAAVSAWVLHGQSLPETSWVRADVARLIGLGKSDIAITTAAYGNDNTGIHVFFGTIPRRPEIVLVRQDKKLKREIYWLVRDGAVSMTVRRLDGKLSVVSGADYEKAGMIVLDYFYDHLPQMKNLSASESGSSAGQPDVAKPTR